MTIHINPNNTESIINSNTPTGHQPMPTWMKTALKVSAVTAYGGVLGVFLVFLGGFVVPFVGLSALTIGGSGLGGAAISGVLFAIAKRQETMHQKALQKIENIEKSTGVVENSRQVLQTVGASKSPNPHNTQDTDLIVRTVMRHPNLETRQLLDDLHKKIKDRFLSHSDEGLEWLLGGSSATARGGFQNAQDLKTFLNTSPKSMSSSRLITGLQTIITAIAYRGVAAKWAKPPHQPETPAQQAMFQLCSDYRKNDVPRITNAFPEKYDSEAVNRSNPILLNSSRFYGSYRNELSDDSDCELPTSLLQPRRPQKIFRKRKSSSHDSTLSWVGAARKANVPIRDSVSGTVSLSLSVLQWLLDVDSETPFQKEVEILGGALFIPTYERGDYHTIAETAAGINFFLALREHETQRSPALPPQHAMAYGFRLMSRVVNETYEPFITALARNRLEQTTAVDYVSDPF